MIGELGLFSLLEIVDAGSKEMEIGHINDWRVDKGAAFFLPHCDWQLNTFEYS